MKKYLIVIIFLVCIVPSISQIKLGTPQKSLFSLVLLVITIYRD